MADRRLVVTQRGTNAQKELQANNAGALYVALEAGSEVTITPPKVSDKYGIQAISDDGTYKYFYFEADNSDWYILRKHKANKVFSYGKGTGGYTTVYDTPTTGPDPAPTWGDRGTIF